jgi:hypothetical protein
VVVLSILGGQDEKNSDSGDSRHYGMADFPAANMAKWTNLCNFHFIHLASWPFQATEMRKVNHY